eukprot:CAMPEP_0170503110 /NCGR_PEP_ID=MMETSP0208-20121228/43666_1 /TAXON_ID=197538 /ORGANISM="Strombidium inclinatum, Strain S3" /LENGTH=59 /DNA_ID=CAMNT_0010782577 /DNA_START=608 /DNA_END=787 /DNA_ORIENTATION=-
MSSIHGGFGSSGLDSRASIPAESNYSFNWSDRGQEREKLPGEMDLSIFEFPVKLLKFNI